MKQISIIWNITKACPWNCSFCCINAYHLPNQSSSDDKLEELKRKRIELSLEEKLKIVSNLNKFDFELDISGGDPLIFRDNLEVISELSYKFGRDNISITTTGVGLDLVNLDSLEEIVGEVGFTYDFPYEPNRLRPRGYNLSNLNSIKKVAKKNIKTMAQIPLTRLNTDEKIIKKIYKNLDNARVNKLYLMKFIPVGRGSQRSDLGLNNQEYRQSVESYEALENDNLKVCTQNALKDSEENSSSLNITSKGLLLSNPWAYDNKGNPIKEFIIGNLNYQKFSDIIKNH